MNAQPWNPNSSCINEVENNKYRDKFPKSDLKNVSNTSINKY